MFLQELSVYGYQSIASHKGLSQIALVNVTRDILIAYKNSLESHSETADLQRNAESELTRLQHLLSLAKVNRWLIIHRLILFSNIKVQLF